MHNLEKVVAKLYIFLLPVRMITPFAFLQNYVGGCALNFDFIFHVMGIVLFGVNAGKISIEKTAQKIWIFFVSMIFIFTILNIGNALWYHQSFGVAYGEDTFGATRGSTLYWIHYALMVIYNIRVFKILGMDKVWKIICFHANILIIVGYAQICVVLIRSSLICKLYDIFTTDLLFLPSSYLLTENRITLMSVEPALAAYTIVRLVMPMLLANLLIEGFSRKNVFKILIWLPVIYFTKSSNAYILVSIEIAVFCILLLIKIVKKRKDTINFYSGCIIVIVSFVALLTPFLLEKIDVSGVVYNLVYKLSDRTNMSTAWRVTPLYINWEIFKRFPILGIGNGNQGFFYWEYFPQWAYNLLADTKTMAASRNVMTNGMLFFPSILSGYGIVGILLFVLFIVIEIMYMCKQLENRKREALFFLIAIAGIIINSFSTDFVGCFDVWFIMSIPFAYYARDKAGKELNYVKGAYLHLY